MIHYWEPFVLFLVGLFSGLSAGIFWATWDRRVR